VERGSAPPVYRPAPTSAPWPAPHNTQPRDHTAQQKIVGGLGTRKDLDAPFATKSSSATQRLLGVANLPGAGVLQPSFWSWLTSCWPCCRSDTTVSDRPTDKTPLVLGSLNRDLEIEPVSSSTGKTGELVSLEEGHSKLVNIGDTVHNAGTTSCGLVPVFGSRGVAAYHWPFMTNSSEHFSKFAAVVSKAGRLTKIEIYTAPIPLKSQSEYGATTRAIHAKYTVPTTHRIYGTDSRDEEIMVTLNARATTGYFGTALSGFLSLS
jgi:hypothetical protein